MTSTLEHRGYVGTVEVDLAERTLYGRVVNMDGGLMYEGINLDELHDNMRGVVDTYIALCADQGKEPRKPFSGDVRLRMDALTHARLAAEAESRGISMNQLAVDTLKQAVGE